MVAQFLGLKIQLLANSFRRSPWHVVGVLIGLFYGLGTALLVAAGLAALRLFDIDVAAGVVIVFGSFIIVVFTVLPLTLGIDDTLDPRRFALFAISPTKMAAALAVAALISVPAVVIAIIAGAQVVTWSRTPDATNVAMVSAVLIVATCILSARISTSLSAFLLSSRRSRDAASVVGLIALVGISPVIISIVSVDWREHGLAVLAEIGAVLGWTPLGAAWAAPASAAAGDDSAAAAQLAIAAVWILVLLVVWRALVAAMLVSPEKQPTAKKYFGLGWFGALPATPAWAIAARSLTYWSRDARYSTSLVVIPLIPIFMVVTLLVAGLQPRELALLPVPVMCLFLSWSVHNDVAFDNTAIWLHLSTSTKGSADRWGRMIPVLLLGVPLVVVGSMISTAIFGDWSVLPSLIGVSGCILLTGLGFSSVMSARFPYPAVRPGDSPFAQPQAGGSSPAGPIQGFSFFAIISLTVPAIAAAVLGFTAGPQWHLVALALGLGIGLIVFVTGVVAGSRVFDRRTSELLEFAMRN